MEFGRFWVTMNKRTSSMVPAPPAKWLKRLDSRLQVHYSLQEPQEYDESLKEYLLHLPGIAARLHSPDQFSSSQQILLNRNSVVDLLVKVQFHSSSETSNAGMRQERHLSEQLSHLSPVSWPGWYKLLLQLVRQSISCQSNRFFLVAIVYEK